MRWAAVACALWACSCSFPVVTYAPDDATSGADAADAAADAAGDSPDPCDKDGDGYKALSCGGNDCNDDDPRVNPGAGFRTDVPDSGPIPGDWNCDGTVELQYVTVTCGATSCNAQGFDAPTSCGTTGQFVVCTGVLCPAVDAGTRTQGCR
ncbi:MAG TPA: hypothetical protein VLM85_32195 [Polyangiaceae bacterium]|nr:hypothetical protein [Polyangiaceae bacterium]